MFSTRKRKVLALVVGFVMVATAAFAAWLVTGSGDVRGRVADELTALTIEPSTTTTKLIPGASGSLDGSITNLNTGDLVLTAVSFGVLTVVDGGGTCTASMFSTTNQTGLSIALPPGTTVVTFPDAISMASNADESCKGKAIAVFATASASTV